MAKKKRQEKEKVFEGEIVEESSSAVAVIKAQESAAIDVAVATANRFPRNMDDFREKLLKYATIDEQVATECFYSKPVGNGEVAEGQSIRLAELVATTYKNIQAAARIIGEDFEKGVITAQGVCWDLEANNRESVEVSRSIKTRTGRLYSPATIEVNKAALCSIARRNAIFAVVPTAIIKSEIDVIRECAKGSVKTVGQRINAMIGYMKKQGIKPQLVCTYVGKADSTEIDAGDLLKLKGLINAVKDGDYPSLREAFAEVSGERPPADDALLPGKHKAPKKEEPPPAQSINDEPTGALAAPPTKPKDEGPELGPNEYQCPECKEIIVGMEAVRAHDCGGEKKEEPPDEQEQEKKRELGQAILKLLDGKSAPYRAALAKMLGEEPTKEQVGQPFAKWSVVELGSVKAILEIKAAKTQPGEEKPEPDMVDIDLNASPEEIREYILRLCNDEAETLQKAIMGMDKLQLEKGDAMNMAVNFEKVTDEMVLWDILGRLEEMRR